MRSVFTIKGNIFFQDLGTGSWGIRSDDGKEYRPINMPNQLKFQDARVEVQLEEIDEDFSIHMWGIPVKVIAFSTTIA